MHLERLSPRQSNIVREALVAAADGPFFPDWEFQTLFGITREQVRRVAAEWPLPNMPPEDVVLAVNNAFNNLLGYPHKKDELWQDWISVDQDKLNEFYNHLRGKTNETHFQRFM